MELPSTRAKEVFILKEHEQNMRINKYWPYLPEGNMPIHAFVAMPICQQMTARRCKSACCLQAELSDLVLKRFLLLAMLLDKVMLTGGLPPEVPLLFCKDATVKSSEEV